MDLPKHLTNDHRDNIPDLGAHITDDDVLLTRAEAAKYLRRSVPTLERWARDGRGPPFSKVGGLVLYGLTGLRRFAGVEAAKR
jgi:excisionase family DNA binding protein